LTEPNPFLQTTIRHWLDLVNELGYQMPFCQILISEGYKIRHISKHNAFEQGKDIIAIDPDGQPVAFQLKGGNISKSVWHSIKDEITELVEYPIVYPAIPKGLPHKSILVTNGNLEDTVRLGIDGLNSGKWKGNKLEVITYEQLLAKFFKASADFTPTQLVDYQVFLELYRSDGRQMINLERFCNLLRNIIRIDDTGLPKEERKRNIATAVLYSSFVLGTFRVQENNVALMQGLTVLTSYIFALVEKYNLPNKYWLPSVELIWEELHQSGAKLEEEVNADGLEKVVISMWDGELAVYRRHIAVSYLIAFKLAQAIKKEPEWNSLASNGFMQKLVKDTSLRINCESSIPTMVFLFHYTYQGADTTSKPVAFKFLQSSLEALLERNGAKSLQGLASPYYDIPTMVSNQYGLLDEPIDESFVGRSFMIRNLVDLFARYDKRDVVEKNWRDITFISEESFEVKELWRYFLWRSEKGINVSKFPKQTQSWKKLQAEACKVNLSKLPKTLQQNLHWLPLFLQVYPHRMTPEFNKLLDDAMQDVKIVASPVELSK